MERHFIGLGSEEDQLPTSWKGSLQERGGCCTCDGFLFHKTSFNVTAADGSHSLRMALYVQETKRYWWSFCLDLQQISLSFLFENLSTASLLMIRSSSLLPWFGFWNRTDVDRVLLWHEAFVLFSFMFQKNIKTRQQWMHFIVLHQLKAVNVYFIFSAFVNLILFLHIWLKHEMTL